MGTPLPTSTENPATIRRRTRICACTKDDILPEWSFQSWSNYVTALRETPARFVDRLKARSEDATELNEVKSRSGNEMRKTLTWWDLMWFSIGSVIGAGIFVLTGQEANEHAGPAVILSYVVSGVSALLSVFCYTEFAVEIPVAGGSFAYLRVELGDFMAFLAAGNILLEYVISGAAVARAWTSYFATLCNHKPEDFRITAPHLSPDFNQLDPIAVVACAVICILAVCSTKGSSRLNYIASIAHIVVIIFIVVAGLTHANVANLKPFVHPEAGVRGIFQASAVLFFAYVGFDAVSTMAEETKNPARDIPIGLITSMVVTTFAYCLLALTLCLMQPYNQIDTNAPFTLAFEKVGMSWAKYIVAFGALKGMTTVLLVSAIGQARYLTHIARTHMMPPWLSKVNETSGTPVNATVVMMVASAIFAFFTDLNILANLLSISTLIIFMLVALALLVRRYYARGVTTPKDRNNFLICLGLILGSAIATSTFWGVTQTGWVAYVVTGPVWFLATLSLKLFVPQARAPTVWGVPLVPWLPSASIMINIFLLGSIDKDSFVRFCIWTVLLLVYYFLFGLHASYDNAMEVKKVRGIENGSNLAKAEDGNSTS